MNQLKWKNDKEYMSYVEDLLQQPEVRQLREYNHHYYNNRLNHSIAVSYYSYLVAKQVNADARAVARAGLLHDLYFYHREEAKEILNGHSHNASHPQIALKNAEHLTELSDIERDIIVSHMWGATRRRPKYKESYIVTLMDKYCAISDLAIPLRNKTRRMVNRYHHKYHHASS